jgi:hypothetical protein
MDHSCVYNDTEKTESVGGTCCHSIDWPHATQIKNPSNTFILADFFMVYYQLNKFTRPNKRSYVLNTN